MISTAEGRLDAFAVGEAGVIHNVFENNEWRGWESLSGSVSSAISAASFKGSKIINIYGTGSNLAMMHRPSRSGDDWEVN